MSSTLLNHSRLLPERDELIGSAHCFVECTSSGRVARYQRDDFFYMAVRVVPELNAKGEIVVLTGHLEVIEQKKNNVKFAFRLSVFFPLQPVGPLWCSSRSAGWPLLFTGVKAETTVSAYPWSGLRTNLLGRLYVGGRNDQQSKVPCGGGRRWRGRHVRWNEAHGEILQGRYRAQTLAPPRSLTARPIGLSVGRDLKQVLERLISKLPKPQPLNVSLGFCDDTRIRPVAAYRIQPTAD